MKKTILLALFALVYQENKAQQTLRDTIRKNEISVNVLPVIVLFGGGFPQTYSNFNISYKRYFLKNKVFRFGFSVFPFRNQDYFNGLVMYDRTVENKTVYKIYGAYEQPKVQFELGMEKLFRYKKFIHGLGAELLLSTNTVNRSEQYIWRNNNQPIFDPGFWNDTTNYHVDSIGFNENYRQVGIGLHLFYNLRYRFAKRFYFFACMGPSFSYVMASGNYYDNATKKGEKREYDYFEWFPLPIFSNFSICYRF